MAVGAAAIAVALVGHSGAPQPPGSSVGTSPGPQQQLPASSTTTTVASGSAPLARSRPASIRIPAIGVDSAVSVIGENADGSIAVPQPGPDYNKAAWYEYSPTPGQVGPSIIEGHVDSAAQGPSVFFKLGDLRPGDEVDVTLADGEDAVFTIDGVRSYPKDQFPTQAVYGNTSDPALRLVTCGGSFDSSTGHYLNNVVAFGHLTGSRPNG